MRRRIRSADLHLHRRALPKIALDGALVALAYYLAFQLRFQHGPAGYYEVLRERTIWWVLAGSMPVLVLTGAYQRRWRYSGQRDYEARRMGRGRHRALVVVARRGHPPRREEQPCSRHLGGAAAERGDRPVRAADARVPGRREGDRTQCLRAPPAGCLPRRAQGRAPRADRRRRRRRAPRSTRDHAQPRARAHAGRLPRRRSRQAAPAHRRRVGARQHRERSAAHPRRGRAGRIDHRDPLSPRLDARADRSRVPFARNPRADAADGLRAPADTRWPGSSDARGPRRGRARPRTGAYGARAGRRLPSRARRSS